MNGVKTTVKHLLTFKVNKLRLTALIFFRSLKFSMAPRPKFENTNGISLVSTLGYCTWAKILFMIQPYLHHTEGLGLLHLAENSTQYLVQLVSQLSASPGNESGHQTTYKSSGELRRARVQELTDNLHDIPQATVALLILPLGNLLQRHGHIGPQAFTTILGKSAMMRVR